MHRNGRLAWDVLARSSSQGVSSDRWARRRVARSSFRLRSAGSATSSWSRALPRRVLAAVRRSTARRMLAMRAAAVLMSALSPDYGGLGAPQSDGSSKEESAPGPLPTITQPKGGGALRGMGEKFSVGSINGTGSLSISLPVAPGRSNFGPELTLAYDSSSGNGPYGLGWSLSTPMITRKTSTGLPRYWDREESDVFVLSGVEDLVPLLDEHLNRVTRVVTMGVRASRSTATSPGWRVCTADRALDELRRRRALANDLDRERDHDLGAGAASCVSDPLDPSRVASWLISESYDARGNAVSIATNPRIRAESTADPPTRATARPPHARRSDTSRASTTAITHRRSPAPTSTA